MGIDLSRALAAPGVVAVYTGEDARKAGIAVDPEKYELIGHGASGIVRGQYVELQSGDQTWDLRGIRPTFVKPYARIRGLFNPGIWVETDEQRRVFMFVDSVVVSAEH